MAIFQDYELKRNELLSKIPSLGDFEKSDETVGRVFDIARAILTQPKDVLSVGWLLQNGAKLAAYYGYLAVKGSTAWAEYKTAEIAFRHTRDALMLVIKNEKATITEAKASAGRETAIAEIDVIVREKHSRDLAAAADWCSTMLSFIQSCMKQLQTEKGITKIADRGRPKE